MLQIINVVVSFFGAFEHFFKINQMSFALYMDFLFVFVSICIFVPILVRILVRIFGSDFWFGFSVWIFCSDFLFRFFSSDYFGTDFRFSILISDFFLYTLSAVRTPILKNLPIIEYAYTSLLWFGKNDVTKEEAFHKGFSKCI